MLTYYFFSQGENESSFYRGQSWVQEYTDPGEVDLRNHLRKRGDDGDEEDGEDAEDEEDEEDGELEAGVRDIFLHSCSHGNAKYVNRTLEDDDVQVRERDLSMGFRMACEGGHELVVREMLRWKAETERCRGSSSSGARLTRQAVEEGMVGACKKGQGGVVYVLSEAGVRIPEEARQVCPEWWKRAPVMDRVRSLF